MSGATEIWYKHFSYNSLLSSDTLQYTAMTAQPSVITCMSCGHEEHYMDSSTRNILFKLFCTSFSDARISEKENHTRDGMQQT